jgi:hypothetical protein
MGQTREAITQHLAERLCWQAAQRDEARVARRLYRKEVVDGVYSLDEGALLDDFFQFLRDLEVWFNGTIRALATAYRLRCERAAVGAEPVGWQRWRQVLDQTRDKIIVFAQRWYGIFPIAAFALLVGGKLKDVPPGLGTPQEVLTKYTLTAES